MKGAYQKYEYFRNKRLPDFFRQTTTEHPNSARPKPQTNTESSNSSRSRNGEHQREYTDREPFQDEARFNGGSTGGISLSRTRGRRLQLRENHERRRNRAYRDWAPGTDFFHFFAEKCGRLWMLYLVLVPVLVFFILKDKQAILNWFARFLPSERALTRQVWEEVNVQTSNYVRGKFWEVIIVWCVTYITLKAFGLRATLLVSLFVGLSVLVPYVGATLMYIPIIILGYYQFGMSSTFVWLFIAYSIIQVLDGNVLAPVLLSEATSLHPIAIIAAILLFGGLWGFWGVFFAIPLATLVNSIIKAWPMEINKALQR